MTDNSSLDLKLEIGGIVVALELHGNDSPPGADQVRQAFLSDMPADVALTVRYSSHPDLDFAEQVFDSRGPWSLYRDEGSWCFVIPPLTVKSELRRVAVLDAEFRKGDVYMGSHTADRTPHPYPLEYPLEELLFMNLLSQGRGVLLHACAVSDNGRGYVFPGSSGAGKSTMAHLWKARDGISILSDDRVIVRERDGRFWAFGTPWHGDVKLCSPEAVPISSIFHLRHGRDNNAKRLEGPKAVTSLFARSFPTYWYPEGMAFTLDFLGRMSREVPCYDLEFLPDQTAVHFVSNIGDA